MHSILFAALILLLTACVSSPRTVAVPSGMPPEPEGQFAQYALRNRPDVAGTLGAVVAGHPLAAVAGHEVLRRGGNAVDAAVTMAAVLAVVRPHMNGVGGDAFALFYDGRTREVTALNGSGRAGALATPTFFSERGQQQIPSWGALSVTVPGAVSAWAAALERYGTLSLAEALEPAIRYAEQGFPISTTLAEDLAAAGGELNEPGRAIFAPEGGLRVGALLRNAALARTLRTLAAEGPDALYGGPIGQALADFMAAEGGYLRIEDFVRHRADWTEPISLEIQRHRAFAVPPNSQGLAQLQQLALAEHFPLQSMGHNSADYLHTLIEIKKIAFADRDRWIADPAFAPTPTVELLNPEYLRERARLVGERAAASVPPGLAERPVAPVGDGEGDTVYLMAVDRWGNAVSWIQSLFASFGSRLVEPTTGIVLQNRGAGFSLDPSHPNVIAPGKRPFHTLTPLLITDTDGQLRMTLGTPGGDSQTQSLLQVYNNVFLFGMTPQEAVEAPRYRSYVGERVALENRISPEARRELESRGHEVRVVDGWTATFGGVQMILVDHTSGVLRTAADPRREAYAIAY